MTYHQLTPAERYMLAALRRQGHNQSRDVVLVDHILPLGVLFSIPYVELTLH
jgi:hypothetical protein